VHAAPEADQYCTSNGTWQMAEASDQHKERNSTLWDNPGNFICKKLHLMHLF
jgi:hypothetical protein